MPTHMPTCMSTHMSTHMPSRALLARCLSACCNQAYTHVHGTLECPHTFFSVCHDHRPGCGKSVCPPTLARYDSCMSAHMSVHSRMSVRMSVHSCTQTAEDFPPSFRRQCFRILASPHTCSYTCQQTCPHACLYTYLARVGGHTDLPQPGRWSWQIEKKCVGAFKCARHMGVCLVAAGTETSC